MNFSIKKLFGFFVVVGVQSLPGAITLTIAEVGNDVAAYYEGSVDLDGLASNGSFSVPSQQVRSQSNLWFATGASTSLDSYTGGTLSFSNPGSLSILGSAGTGFGVGVQTSDRLFVGSGYTSGTPVDGFVLFENESFSSLGLTDGVTTSYSWNATSGLQSVILTTDQNATLPIPEPSVFLCLGLGSLCFASLRRRIQ